MANCGCEIEIKNNGESKVLIILLSINAVMFITEFVFVCLCESTGLIADSLDMLADALVYGVGLYAVGKSLRIKVNSAMLSGCLQITLGSRPANIHSKTSVITLTLNYIFIIN